MKTFMDNAGRSWVIQINVFAVKRLRGLLKVDLYSLIDGQFEGLGKLMSDPIQLVDVVYVLCKDEADKLGVSDEDFGRSMAGDAIESAANAFLEEFTDFFPDPRVRAGIRKVIEKSRAVTEVIGRHAMETIDRMSLEMLAAPAIAKIDAEARKLNGSSGKSLERSESTLTPLRSVS